MPLPFNKTLDLKLLQLVKDNPIIYNTKHKKYLDFDNREVVWQKIGDALNRPASICKSRWINIRDMMRRKLRDRLRNPHQKSYNYKYEDELSFMLPYFREMSSNDYADYLEEASEAEIPVEVFGTEVFGRETEMKPVFRSKRDDTFEFQDLNPSDPLDVFLITIGSTLRKLTPCYLNQAKSKIFQIVQDYELQQIMEKDSQPNTSTDNR
ncbi:unnamed protein product [Colias eurytheme]|nr:unnamed protein product [Colias eurytheme]